MVDDYGSSVMIMKRDGEVACEHADSPSTQSALTINHKA